MHPGSSREQHPRERRRCRQEVQCTDTSDQHSSKLRNNPRDSQGMWSLPASAPARGEGSEPRFVWRCPLQVTRTSSGAECAERGEGRESYLLPE